MRLFKPKGFFPPERYSEIEKASDSCMAFVSSIPMPFVSENDRKTGLSAFRRFVEIALGEILPDDWAERTVFLEEVVDKMHKVRLASVDREVLMAIGNLLIDSGIRKGRGLDEKIPKEEVIAQKEKYLRYLRYTVGKL
jgi:hypothetical protein